MKLNLDNISLLCVETRNPTLAKFALDKCLDVAKFHECILLTSNIFDLPAYINQIKIPEIKNTEDYSKLMIFDLPKYFSGEYVLVVQWDGFIIDHSQWDPSFLSWDYIGAPWHHHGNMVGNGGFSLRSRRLCTVVSTISNAYENFHPEDLFICVDLRSQLEREHGIKFAPSGQAARFAFEDKKPKHATFGIHGWIALSYAMNDSDLRKFLAICDKKMLASGGLRGLIRALINQNRFLISLKFISKIIIISPKHFLKATWLCIRLTFQLIIWPWK